MLAFDSYFFDEVEQVSSNRCVMSHFSLKMMFPLLVVVLVFAIGGVFFAATGLVTPLADALAVQQTSNDSTEAFDCGVLDGPSKERSAVALIIPTAEAAAVAAGDALFKGNCAQCHAVNEVVVGPALANLDRRRPVAWLIPWIRNSSKVVASGDEYAVKIFNQFQKQQMPSFDLSDQEITQILAYLKAESNSGMARASAVALN